MTKIVPRERLVKQLESRRDRAVVLANGVFDLVHVGHARYFEDARSRGDLLIVALNDDASTRRAKGNTRPIVPLDDRLLVVAGFRSVDFVTWFSEATLGETLRRLRPRFHAKGTDYSPDSLPEDERSAHRELGIDVVIVGDPKNHATRSLIDTILSAHSAPD